MTAINSKIQTETETPRSSGTNEILRTFFFLFLLGTRKINSSHDRSITFPLMDRVQCSFSVAVMPDTGVISVLSALYGRADHETCSDGRPQQQLDNTRCSQEGTVDVIKNRYNLYLQQQYSCTLPGVSLMRRANVRKE